ncbi:hypothetical protein Tco_0347738 [Tanacetum coccineum]
MAGLLFRMFWVDKTEVRGTMLGEQLQLEIGEFRTELAMQILDHVFQADQCDVFDSDVDEAPTAQTMFVANLSSTDPTFDEAGPSYDSNILSEVQDHDNYIDSVGEYQEVHEMQNDVQQNCVAAQCVSANDQNKLVNESLTTELARYKEQVEIYKKKGKELHSVKMQLNSTIDHNKLMKDEVAALKNDFKQKENKYLEDFLDMKALKEKVKDKLFKQDQSLQTVHMLCKLKPYYDEKKKVAIGYKNPLYLTNAMQVQSALYNGHEIVKTNHAPTVVHDSEDTLELAEILLCVEKKVKIAPSDYSKENYLATFIPQRPLTSKHIFWSLDTQVLTSKLISKMTVYKGLKTKKKR